MSRSVSGGIHRSPSIFSAGEICGGGGGEAGACTGAAAIGAGIAPDGKLAEGVDTAPALVARAKAVGVEMPIAEAMADLLSGALPIGEAMMRLMSRPLKAEA